MENWNRDAFEDFVIRNNFPFEQRERMIDLLIALSAGRMPIIEFGWEAAFVRSASELDNLTRSGMISVLEEMNSGGSMLITQELENTSPIRTKSDGCVKRLRSGCIKSFVVIAWVFFVVFVFFYYGKVRDSISGPSTTSTPVSTPLVVPEVIPSITPSSSPTAVFTSTPTQITSSTPTTLPTATSTQLPTRTATPLPTQAMTATPDLSINSDSASILVVNLVDGEVFTAYFKSSDSRRLYVCSADEVCSWLDVINFNLLGDIETLPIR